MKKYYTISELAILTGCSASYISRIICRSEFNSVATNVEQSNIPLCHHNKLNKPEKIVLASDLEVFKKILKSYMAMTAREKKVKVKMDNYGLSPREKEVLGLACQGKDNGEIADELFVCEYTIKSHLQAIYQKFHLSSHRKKSGALRVKAVLFAFKNNIIHQ